MSAASAVPGSPDRTGNGRPKRARDGRVTRWRRDVAAAELGATTRVLTWMLATLGGLALWIVVFGLFLSGLQEQHDQHNLYASFRKELAAGVAPLGGAIGRGAPVALLQSNAGDLDDLVVVEGTTSDDLRSGPGHVPGAPLPGQPGVSQIYGRSTTFGGPFSDIGSLVAGDAIIVTTGQGTFHYVVEDVRRAGDPFPPALEAGGSQLTLVTSDGSGWRSGLAPSGLLYVDTLLAGPSVAAPDATTTLTSSDSPLARDTSGLYPMILWLQLLVLAVVAIVWSALRWGRWQTWLMGAPIVLAALWGATSAMWLLLPNVV